MTKAELIAIVSEKVEGLNKTDAAVAVDVVFDTIGRALEEEGRLAVPGFGTFEVKSRAERKGRNPKTGEEITIAASKSVGFKPAAALKSRVS